MGFGVDINWLAVLVSAVAGFIIGMLWYGPLFGKQWMKLSGHTKQSIEKSKQKGMAGKFVLALVAALVMASVLALFVGSGGAVSASVGIAVGFWIWLGFLATSMLDGVLWDGKPWGLYLINTTFRLVELIVMGAILGAWA